METKNWKLSYGLPNKLFFENWDGSHHFWELSYGNWELSDENWWTKRPLNILPTVHSYTCRVLYMLCIAYYFLSLFLCVSYFLRFFSFLFLSLGYESFLNLAFSGKSKFPQKLFYYCYFSSFRCYFVHTRNRSGRYKKKIWNSPKGKKVLINGIRGQDKLCAKCLFIYLYFSLWFLGNQTEHLGFFGFLNFVYYVWNGLYLLWNWIVLLLFWYACQFVIGPLTQNREAPIDTNQRGCTCVARATTLFI